MAAKLAVNVVLQDPATDAPAVFLAGTAKRDLPKWAADSIGAHCYEDGTVQEEAAVVVQEPSGGSGDNGGGEVVEVPARVGKGSGRDAWAAYAATFEDLEITEDLKRDDIIALLEAAGHPIK